METDSEEIQLGHFNLHWNSDSRRERSSGILGEGRLPPPRSRRPGGRPRFAQTATATLAAKQKQSQKSMATNVNFVLFFRVSEAVERLTEKVPRRGGRPEPRILLRPFHKRSAAKPASLSAELHWQEKMEPRHGKRQGDSETRRQEGQGRGETVPACKMRGDHAGPPPQDAPDLCPRSAGRGRRGQGAAPGLVPLGPGLALKAGPPTSLLGGAPHHVPLGQPGAPARGGRRRWPAGLDLEAPQTLPPDG